MRLWKITTLAILSAACLLGCAGQAAFRQGKDLIEQDKVEDGLAKLREANAADPRNLEFRTTLIQSRDRAIYIWTEQAGKAMATGKPDEAGRLYRRILGVDPQNDRARAGLARLDTDRRHIQLLQEGLAALDQKDLGTARSRLNLISSENPDGESARVLQRAITERSKPATTDSASLPAYRKPITIEFREASLRQVFDVVSRTAGLNFIFDKDVKTDQRTSVFLKNSTVEAAIHFLLLTNQLEQQILDGNTVLIYPNTAAKQKDYQELVVKSFYLTNADAKVVANTLKTMLKSRDLIVDDRLNLLILRDSPEAIRLAEKLVALHDVPEAEVMLEVEILEVKRTRLQELGIQWPTSLSLTPLQSAGGGGLTLDALRGLNGSTIGAEVGPVSARVRLQDGNTNILANPRIRARNREKAKVLIGERVPNITTTATATGFVSESINYVDVGLKLDVEPTVYLDNDVAIRISLEVSSVTNQIKTQSGTVAYQIGTRTASTVLRLKDGENQVLAGLINDEDRRTGNKIPGFGDLPIVGRLFGSTVDDSQKTEIVLSITPRLVRNVQRPDAATAEFRSGTDSSFRMRPDSISSPSTVPAIQSASPAAVPAANPAVAPPAPAANPVGPMTPQDVPGPVGGSAIQLHWKGPEQVKAGESFDVQLMMQSNLPVTSVPMTIGFDTKLLQLAGVSEGVFLKQGGAQAAFSTRTDGDGRLAVTYTRNGAGGATDMATVATFTFRALGAADSTTVKLLTVSPNGTAGHPINAPTLSPFKVKVM